MAWIVGKVHTGHAASELSQMRLAQSEQKKLCPHGTNACVTLASMQTMHFADPSNESTGLVLFAGDGREGADVVEGYVQMLDNAVVLSKLGESPIPSSRSLELQMAPKSPRPPVLDELLEQDPELEKAPELPVEDVMFGNASPEGSMQLKSELKPVLYKDAKRSLSSKFPKPFNPLMEELPVLMAM